MPESDGQSAPAVLAGLDVTSVAIQRHAATIGDRERWEPVRALREDVFSFAVTDTELGPCSAARVLLTYEVGLLSILRQRLSQHSRFYWLHILRRIAPGPAQGLPVDSWTEALEQSVLRLAAMKYGLAHAEDVHLRDCTLVDGAGPIALARAVARQDIVALLQCQRLAEEVVATQQLLRMAWKGSPVVFHHMRPLRSAPSEELDNLVKLYDARTLYVQSGFGAAGLQLDLHWDPEEMRTPDTDPWLLCVPLPNTNSLPWGLNMAPHHVPIEDALADDRLFRPNHLPLMLDLRPLAEVMRLFEAGIRATVGVGPDEVIAATLALGTHKWLAMQVSVAERLQFFQRGYSLVRDTGAFLRDATRVGCRMIHELGTELAVDDAETALQATWEYFTWSEEDICSIDLGVRLPVKAVLRTDVGDTLDWTEVIRCLSALLNAVVTPDGAPGQRRGELFEAQAKEHVASELSGVVFWEPARELVFPAGPPGERDICIHRGDALLVVECRSAVGPPALDRGEPAALDHRKRHVLKRKLRQADELGCRLATWPVGENYELPDEVTHVVTLACGPFAEYMHRREPGYFLSYLIPRMCTPSELVMFVRDFDLAEHLGKPYCYEVQR